MLSSLKAADHRFKRSSLQGKHQEPLIGVAYTAGAKGDLNLSESANVGLSDPGKVERIQRVHGKGAIAVIVVSAGQFTFDIDTETTVEIALNTAWGSFPVIGLIQVVVPYVESLCRSLRETCFVREL